MEKNWKIKAFVDNAGMWSRWIERQSGKWTLCIPCAGGAERWIVRREISREDVRELVHASRPVRQAYLAHGKEMRQWMETALAARDLAIKRIGFSEFKRIVRENS